MSLSRMFSYRSGSSRIERGTESIRDSRNTRETTRLLPTRSSGNNSGIIDDTGTRMTYETIMTIPRTALESSSVAELAPLHMNDDTNTDDHGHSNASAMVTLSRTFSPSILLRSGINPNNDPIHNEDENIHPSSVAFRPLPRSEQQHHRASNHSLLRQERVALGDDDEHDGDNDVNDNNLNLNDEVMDNEEMRPGSTQQDQRNQNDSPEGQVRLLTDRLRCLFAILTLPILPLGSLLALLLLHLVYSTLIEVRHSCSHPLKTYAIISVLLFLYAPNHKYVKSRLFRYSRERDGPNRPRSVRIYDQCFHVVCLLYVYSGMMLLQGCREDIPELEFDWGEDCVVNASSTAIVIESGDGESSRHGDSQLDADVSDSSASFQSTCAATCPTLYASTLTFVATLEVFAGVLLLPLVCLPCVYLWILRRVRGVDPEVWEEHLRREAGENSITKKDVMDALETVKLVLIESNTVEEGKGGNGGQMKVKVISNADERKRVEDFWKGKKNGLEGQVGEKVDVRIANEMGKREKAEIRKICEWDIVKDCCICMSEFETCSDKTISATLAASVSPLLTENGLDIEAGIAYPQTDDNNLNGVENETIVQTKCGHLFHRVCIGGWIGGNWADSVEFNQAENDNGSSSQRVERARRRCCPLCRENLTPS